MTVTELKPLYDLLPKGDGKVRIKLPKDHVYVPSATPGHGHLLVLADVNEFDYMVALSLLATAGVIENGFLYFSVNRKCTTVRRPGVLKPEALIGKPKGTPQPKVVVEPTTQFIEKFDMTMAEMSKVAASVTTALKAAFTVDPP